MNVDYSTNLPLGRVLVMSDGKCKSSFISPSVVLNATMEQVTDRWKANHYGHERIFAYELRLPFGSPEMLQLL